MQKIIGKIAATEKNPTNIDYFHFWCSHDLILNPFDVVTVDHVRNSKTFGMVEEISHITDTASYLSDYISNDFGDVEARGNTERINMNYVKAKVVGNTGYSEPTEPPIPLEESRPLRKIEPLIPI